MSTRNSIQIQKGARGYCHHAKIRSDRTSRGTQGSLTKNGLRGCLSSTMSKKGIEKMNIFSMLTLDYTDLKKILLANNIFEEVGKK